MKWILAILILMSASANAQIGHGDDSAKYIRYQNQYGTRMPRSWWDSVSHQPYGDTTIFPKPSRPGAIMMHTDKVFYKWNGTRWVTLEGSGASGSAGGDLAGTYPNPTINNNAVTNAKAAQMAAHTFKGNNTGSTANASDLTATQLTAELNVFGASLKGLVPAAAGSPSSSKYLSEDGTFSIPAGGTVNSQFSVVGDGSSGSKLQLTNDASTPGNDQIYGTDYSGTKGYVPPDVAWHNLVKAGADNTGAVDISTYLTAAMAAGVRYIYLPKGTYLLSSTVQMKDSVTIKGDGRQNTIIKLTSNITAFNLTNTLGGKKCQFLDFGFQGTFGQGGSNTNQKGIVADSVTGMYIHNVGNYQLAGYFVTIKNNGLLSGDGFTFGNIISDCYSENGYGGVYFDVRGEYNTVQGCSFVSGTYGVRVAGGNNRIIGNNLSSNGYNIYLETGGNDGHGTATGNTLNHAGTANVYATGVVQGFEFTGNMIYSGNITLINSDLLSFNGGDISVSTVTVTNCTHTNFKFVKFISEPTWSVTGNSPGVIKMGEASTEGFIIRDPKNNVNMPIINNNGAITIGSSAVDRFMFTKTIVGAGGNFSSGADLCVAKARFDLGSTTGDGVQIYKTGSSGSSLAVLDASANYQIYTKTNGNTGVGNNGSPTAKLHIGAGTAAAGTAPLKFTSGTNLTTPEDGSVEYNGTHFYATVGSTRYQLDQQGGGSNFANANLTFTGNRTHTQAGYSLSIVDNGENTLKLDPANGSYQIGKSNTNGAYLNLDTIASLATLQAGNAHYMELDAVSKTTNIIMNGGFQYLALDANNSIFKFGDISAGASGNNTFLQIDDANELTTLNKQVKFSDYGTTTYSVTPATTPVFSSNGTMGARVAPKIYTVLLSQSGTSAPTPTVLGTNEIGTIVWTRNSIGNYTGTLTGAFTANKTWLICQKGDGAGNYVNGFLTRTSADALTLDVRDNVNSLTDSFTNMSIEIRVYP